MSDDEPDWNTVVVPDDATGLEADERALRRERAQRRRHARWRRLTGGDRFRAYGITASVVVVAFAAIAAFGGLLVLFGPHQRSMSATTPRPSPTAEPGRPGGRLPSVTLRQDDGATLDATTLSGPATLLLVPPGCDCARTLQVEVDTAGRQGGMRAYVIEPATGGVADAGGAATTRYTDTAGTLLADYGSLGTAPTLLLLDAGGAVTTVQVGLTVAQGQ